MPCPHNQYVECVELWLFVRQIILNLDFKITLSRAFSQKRNANAFVAHDNFTLVYLRT